MPRGGEIDLERWATPLWVNLSAAGPPLLHCNAKAVTTYAASVTTSNKYPLKGR
jgi:hypothetical protein